MIISHTIKFGSRKWRINVKNTCFLERSNTGHQMFFGVLSIMPCATAVNDFLGVLCATLVSHIRPNVRPCEHEIFVSLLSTIDFQCYDHFVSYVTTTFVSHNVCDHNFSLVFRFILQFSQNYINIDTDEIQH